MNPLIAIVLYLALFVAVTGVGRAGWEVYLNLKKGKRLSDEWGAVTCQYIGLLALAVYPLLPRTVPAEWRSMTGFIGVSVLGVGSFLRWRLVWPKEKHPDKERSAKQTTPKQVTDR